MKISKLFVFLIVIISFFVLFGCVVGDFENGSENYFYYIAEVGGGFYEDTPLGPLTGTTINEVILTKEECLKNSFDNYTVFVFNYKNESSTIRNIKGRIFIDGSLIGFDDGRKVEFSSNSVYGLLPNSIFSDKIKVLGCHDEAILEIVDLDKEEVIGEIIFTLENYFEDGIENKDFDERWLVCENTIDCILVQDYACCPCGDVAINKEFLDNYYFFKGFYLAVNCFGIMCAPCEQLFYFKPECVSNKCIVSVDCEKTCVDWDEKLKNPHLSEEYLDSMKDYLLDSGCECLTKLINDYYSSSEEKDFIEKKIFTDVYGNFHKKYSTFWDNGDANFVLIDPNGVRITSENYEEINADEDANYHISWWKRYSIVEEWGASKNITIFFKSKEDSNGFKRRNAVDGYWTLRAENFVNGFDSFTVIPSSQGSSNVFLIVDRIGEISGRNKIEYNINEKIVLNAYISGPFGGGLSDVPITGTVKFRSEQYFRTGNPTEYDNVVKEFVFEEVVDSGEKTGSYYYVFDDFFGGEGTYDFRFIADNLEGNAITNNYNLVGYIPPITKVPPFNRAASFQLFISDE